MQAQVTLEEKEVVIRFPKGIISQEAVANFLDYIELTALSKNSQLNQEQAEELAKEINSDVWQMLADKVLCDR